MLVRNRKTGKWQKHTPDDLASLIDEPKPKKAPRRRTKPAAPPPPPPPKKKRRVPAHMKWLEDRGFSQHARSNPDPCQSAHGLTARLCPCVDAATILAPLGDSCDAACASRGLVCHGDVLRAANDVACLSPRNPKRHNVLPGATARASTTLAARRGALPALVDGHCLAAAPDAKDDLTCAAAHPEHARLCPCAR